jgi:ribulose 1,5-bisphosphate synthetase/thiazole synthase
MKSTYLEPAREIPVKCEVDVLVCGAGPSGFAAAVAAARAGASTLLIEQTSAVGGVATSGMMSHWTGDSEGPILDELLHRACEIERDYHYYGAKVLKGRNINNPEKTRAVMLEMLEQSGAQVQLYTLAASIIKQGNRVCGIITESKSGREAIFSKVVIDATGDGDVSAKAGAEYIKGRESDQAMQPVTVMFKVGGVDTSRAIYPGEFEDYIQVPNGEIQALAREQLPRPAGHVLLYPTSLPGVVTVNMTNMTGIDGTKVEDLTRGDIGCRRQIPLIVDFLRRNAPGYENCFVVSSAPMLGVRETRHFEGLYIVQKEDIEAARIFDDWIATRCFFNFDIHSLTGPGLDDNGAQNDFAQKRKYTLPYRALVPKSVDGLLFAGRNISGTHVAHSNFRAMAIALNIGQGAGIAAALCAREGKQPREMNVESIQAILVSQGVTP